jgi:hypothetical protein
MIAFLIDADNFSSPSWIDERHFRRLSGLKDQYQFVARMAVLKI